MDVKPWSKLQAELYSLFARNPASNRQVVELARLGGGETTLDIGCGPGAAVRAAASALATGRAYGVDASPAMIRIARRRSAGIGNLEFTVGTAESIPFEAGIFDVVWTIHAFHHWADEERALAEVRRVLAPGGSFLVLERLGRGGHAMTERTAADAARRVETAGFSPVEIEKEGKQMIVRGSAG